MKIEQIFNEISIQMRSDFERSRNALSHAGLKGASNEDVVKSFLKQYLPRNLEISSGMVVDSNGGISRQMDIIIHDAAKTPIFFQSSEIRVIPVECVYAVIEVKAFLDKSELEKSFENMKSVKSLEKVAFFDPNSVIVRSHKLYGKNWRHWPISHFVFAFDSPNLDSVHANLKQIEIGHELHKRIDTVCVLNKGVIINQTAEGNFTALPEPNSRLVVSHTQKPLLFFYAVISVVLNQAEMSSFNIQPYLGEIRF